VWAREYWIGARRWPLWGVLLSGALSSLLWVRGPELFKGHPLFLLACVVALPIVGGMSTPEHPFFTVTIFAVGSYPPLNDVPPIPVGLLPFAWAYSVVTSDMYASKWHVLLSGSVGVLAVTGIAMAVMAVLHGPLVYVGWKLRRGTFRLFR
jgi:hypothetical protein